MKRIRYMGFYGFNFTDEALNLSPSFCHEANKYIHFLPNGCVEWMGKRRKVWLKYGVYVLRPVFSDRGSPQNLLHLLHAFTVGQVRNNYKGTKIAMGCKNPLCVNPDHMVIVDKMIPLSELYPDSVVTMETDFHKPLFKYFAIQTDYRRGVVFRNLMDLSLFLRASHKLIADYVKTGRRYKGQWIVGREKVPINYVDLELDPPIGYEIGEDDEKTSIASQWDENGFRRVSKIARKNG